MLKVSRKSMNHWTLDMPQTSRWCLGLPFVSTRPINNDESNRCLSELRRAESRLKRQGWVYLSFAAVAVLVSVQYAFAVHGPVGNDPSLIFFSMVAIWLGVAGLAGSFGEIIFGSRVSRIIFAPAIAGLGISFAFDRAWSETLGVCAGMVALIGGNAMAVRQVQERRRLTRVVQNLRDDLLEGVAWRFEREFPTGDETSPVSRCSADVLPRSNFAIAINGRTAERWMTLNVAEVAGGTGGVDAPLTTFAPAQGLDRFDFRQRHLTPGEKNELAGFLRRDLKNLLVRSIILLWASTVLATGADAVFNHHPIEFSARSVFTGAAFVFVFLLNRIRGRRSVKSDLRGGVVVVIRPRDASAEGTGSEQLPRSRMVWSRFGVPASWRTMRNTGYRT